MTVTITDDGTLLDDGVESVRVEVLDGDPRGIDLFSAEAESRLLPIVGPTVFLLARNLVRRYDTAPLGNVTLITDIAQALGVPTSKVRQAIKRAHRYGVLVHQPRHGTVEIRRRWVDRKRRAA